MGRIKNSFQNHPKNHLQNLKFRNKCDILDIRKLIIFKLLSNCNSDRNSFTNYLAVAVIEQSILLVITHEKDRYNTFYQSCTQTSKRFFISHNQYITTYRQKLMEECNTTQFCTLDFKNYELKRRLKYYKLKSSLISAYLIHACSLRF